jgi:hypothetical protein
MTTTLSASRFPLLTALQVAKLLGISVRQVLRLPITKLRFGHRTIRYRKEDVDAFTAKTACH